MSKYTLPPFTGGDVTTKQEIESYGRECAEAARAPLIAANAALSEANASLLARIAELESESENLRSVMIAAAE